MPGGALPAGVKVDAGGGQWAGPDVTDPNNELDVWVVTSDGKLAHWWLSKNKWQGPEYFG